jgi:hypothetical protein
VGFFVLFRGSNLWAGWVAGLAMIHKFVHKG